MPIKLTLDANCIINLLDSKRETATSVETLQSLIQAGLSGHAQIAITTRVETDLSGDKNVARRTAMLASIGMFPVVGSVFRLDTSFLDGGDSLASKADVELSNEIQRIIFPGLLPTDKRYGNKINDVDHLTGHRMNGRDIFVTDDREILKREAELERAIGIRVMSPLDALAVVEKIQLDARKPFDVNKEEYQNQNLIGEATFDYSNNNGEYTIGEGDLSFNTKWSKASDTSIHAYSGGHNVDAIALAKGAREFAEISDASALNFSSRVRSPQIGQIVVWRNALGFYAATKIIAIKDDTRGAAQDELSFKYFIQIDRSHNFIR